MFFFGDIVQFCYLDKKQSISMPYWYIPMVFSPRFFFNQKAWGHVGPQKSPKNHRKVPHVSPLRRTTWSSWTPSKSLTAWTKNRRTRLHRWMSPFFFFHKRALFFFGGEVEIDEKHRTVWKVQDSRFWVSIYLYIYIRIWLNCSNFTLSRFLRPAMLTYLYGRSNY